MRPLATSNGTECGIHITSPARAARAAYWNAIICEAYLTVVAGLSGMSPLHSLGLAVIAMSFMHAQLELLWAATALARGPSSWVLLAAANGSSGEWRQMYEHESLVPLYFRLIPIAATFCIAFLQDCTHRDEFCFAKMLQCAQEICMEQLRREKDHLSWERKLQQHVSDGMKAASPDKHTLELAVQPPQSEWEFGAGSSVNSSGASCAEIQAIMAGGANHTDNECESQSMLGGSVGGFSMMKSSDPISEEVDVRADDDPPMVNAARRAALWRTLKGVGILTLRRG